MEALDLRAALPLAGLDYSCASLPLEIPYSSENTEEGTHGPDASWCGTSHDSLTSYHFPSLSLCPSAFQAIMRLAALWHQDTFPSQSQLMLFHPQCFCVASLIDYFWCNQFNYNLFYDVFLEPSMLNWLSPLWCSQHFVHTYLSYFLFSFINILFTYYMILLHTLIYLIVVCYIVNQQSSNISGQKNLKEGAAETIYWTTMMYRLRTEKIVACQIDGTQCVS